MVNFLIEEILIDGVSFDSSLVLFRLQPQLVILTKETLVLMHQLCYILLPLLYDGLQLLYFYVFLVVVLQVRLEVGEHVAEGGFELVQVLLL